MVETYIIGILNISLKISNTIPCHHRVCSDKKSSILNTTRRPDLEDPSEERSFIEGSVGEMNIEHIVRHYI